MRFSIVIPTYNGSDFIKETIKSALSQTRPADEIIVSDDNSSDNTLDICNQFKDSIMICSNPDGPSGFVNGWNRAIEKATGDFITILHQDDTISPTFLEEAEKALIANPDIKHLFVPCEYIDNKGNVIQQSPISSGEIKRYSGVDYVKAYQQIGRPHIHRCPGVITHRSIFKKCQYREEAGHIADDDFFYRVGQYTDVIGILRPLSQYRLHEKSETGHLNEINLIQRLINDYSFQIQVLDKNTIFDNECKEFFRHWLAKLIEMELIYLLRSNDKEIESQYRIDKDLLTRYNLSCSFRYKLLNKLLGVCGLKACHYIVSAIYSKNQDYIYHSRC